MSQQYKGLTFVIFQAGKGGPKVDRIPISRIGIDVEGTVSIEANGPNGEPFTFQIEGRLEDGRKFLAILKALNAEAHGYSEDPS